MRSNVLGFGEKGSRVLQGRFDVEFRRCLHYC
jgi:hypothetical protein